MDLIMSSWSIIAAVLAVLAVVYYRATRNFAFFKKHGIPYAKPIPFLGSMWEMFFQRISFADLAEKLYNLDSDSKYV
ncbi:unnamed protein product, partial [Heterotrigona itama]